MSGEKEEMAVVVSAIGKENKSKTGSENYCWCKNANGVKFVWRNDIAGYPPQKDDEVHVVKKGEIYRVAELLKRGIAAEKEKPKSEPAEEKDDGNFQNKTDAKPAAPPRIPRAVVKKIEDANRRLAAPARPDSWTAQRLSGRLPEIGQIRIGEQGKPYADSKGVRRYAPRRLDHFRVYTMDRGPQRERVLFDEVHKVIGDKPKEIPIMFLSNNPFDNYFQYYGLYKARRCSCRGNGEFAVIQATGDQITCPCDKYDAAQDGGECHKHAVLHCILPFLERTGGIFTFRSRGIHTFENIRNQFPFLYFATEGHIAGVEFRLKVLPFQTLEHGIAYSVHLEFPASMDALKAAALERARLQTGWEREMKALTAASVEILTRPESPEEQANINEEFSPDTVGAVGAENGNGGGIANGESAEPKNPLNWNELLGEGAAEERDA